MEAKHKLEQELQALREKWVKASEQGKEKIEAEARLLIARIKLLEWADEYRQKNRQFYLNRNGATAEEAEAIFK